MRQHDAPAMRSSTRSPTAVRGSAAGAPTWRERPSELLDSSEAMTMPQRRTQTTTFSFEGTVRKVKAATMRSVPVDNRTVVVRVDRILEAPEDFLPYLGQDITVLLDGREKVKAGQQRVFHTVGWMFGDGIAVRSAGPGPAPPRGAALRALAGAGDPVARRATREAQERFDAADVVVSGRVVAVKVPKGQVGRRRAARAATDEPMRSEEHTSELQSRPHLVCRLLLEKKKKITQHGPT